MKKGLMTSCIIATLALSGCATDEADVYDADDLNVQQSSQTVEILDIRPAKIKSANNEAKGIATALGAAVGGILGNKTTKEKNSTAGTALGAVAGGAAGYGAAAAVGSVKSDGVTITYRGRNGIRTSTQKGRMCQFKEGTALMVSTRKGDTRIQPNAECTKGRKK
ncbi:MAG: glycine zipper 2TM domain-containing protein [Neisseriaceae bacterium]|nr:glycine zipper 2TM domain-containing protein [Neisseriaceae bacterium]